MREAGGWKQGGDIGAGKVEVGSGAGAGELMHHGGPAANLALVAPAMRRYAGGVNPVASEGRARKAPPRG